ncbi:hypothetical protein B296_00021699 [Ensete ventricosum]|uniref:Uncharacterized protein n=1 Tax=Ensete ventricosum TaxID=4639 RepID=A0A426ZAL1_ENSVE|nr:hypothetical protein B296_00021699 [Ensete ventricosum]
MLNLQSDSQTLAVAPFFLCQQRSIVVGHRRCRLQPRCRRYQPPALLLSSPSPPRKLPPPLLPAFITASPATARPSVTHCSQPLSSLPSSPCCPHQAASQQPPSSSPATAATANCQPPPSLLQQPPNPLSLFLAVVVCPQTQPTTEHNLSAVAATRRWPLPPSFPSRFFTAAKPSSTAASISSAFSSLCRSRLYRTCSCSCS